MAQVIDYAKKFSPVVDERFKEEAKTNGLVNQNYDWVGAKTVAVYSVSTATMNDYGRTGELSRFGTLEDLNATTQEMTLTKDRSFTFAIDKMQADETAQALEAGSALARQLREVVIPEIDEYRLGVMAAGAGNTVPLVLSDENIYGAILDATAKVDEAEVPVTGRQLVVTPATYKLLKQSKEVILETEIAQEKRDRGVIAMVDGMEVLRVPANRIGVENFGFMVAHPVATPAPVKLADYRVHQDPVGVSGALVEGRVYYDAFVLANKENAIYVHINNAS